MSQKTALTLAQKKTLIAVAYDGSYQYFPSQEAGTPCARTTTTDALSPWWPSPRALLSLRHRGLLDVADAGAGSWRGSLNEHGREAFYAIIASDPDWLHDHPQPHNRHAARQFLDGIILPPGKPRSIAAILRDARG